MAAQQVLSFEIDTHNPFEQVLNASKIMSNLERLDSVSITKKFKTSQDPIKYAFEAIDDVSLHELAVDFVKETVADVFEFVSRICK